MTTIERKYCIARSTLSGWFKEVELSEEQRTRLMKNSQDEMIRIAIIGRPRGGVR